jgi:hypothetical protein
MGRGRPGKIRRSPPAVATLVTCAVFAAASSAAGKPIVKPKVTPIGGPPCAAETAHTFLAVDGMVAERIYRQELEGPATVRDRHQVESYEPLSRALAEGNRKAIRGAVVALVYSHTHIVRLRVSHNGSLLADIGGPYIIAPVRGQLSFHGRHVGSYVLSVQDDLGYVGLETRLIGAPVALFVKNARLPIEGTMRTGRIPLPDRGTVTINGGSYTTYAFDARAYPAGVLRIVLLRPHRPDSSRSCAAVRVAETGRIGRAIWRRFMLDGSPVSGFVDFTRAHTGALTYVRAGRRQLAGSTDPGPPPLPPSGSIRYRGVTYGVTSFTSTSPSSGAVRIYQLVAL